MSSSNLTCCCGRPDCAYLQHNHLALSGLERDVETAAQLGQALLQRHETYMAESEAERRTLSGTIESLTVKKRDLEVENARIVEENRALLDQLEALNNSILDSDAHIKSLNATLVAAQLEVKRLSSLATRTADLEAQLAEMQVGQAQLQEELSVSREDEKSALGRWRRAETTLRNLSEQIERIEKEAHDERERHTELIGRMERKRIVESELQGAAGRLKGAAAAASLGRTGAGTNVVSHFVRDILQDNANLQAGIVELRDLLQASNEEVENLREQILLHQPLSKESGGHVGGLNEELERSASQHSQQVHVHHHYHTAPGRKPSFRKEKTPMHPRGRRPRSSIAPVVTGRLPGTPSSERSSSHAFPTPHSRNPSNRWSVQSSATAFSNMSAFSSSPVSAHRTSSIFDRIEADYDSSRPTSPESTGLASPYFMKGHRKDLSDFSFRSLRDTPSKVTESAEERLSSISAMPEGESDLNEQPSAEIVDEELAINDQYVDSLRIPEEVEDDSRSPDTELPSPESPSPGPTLRRSTSHESLISISGMDIHTLKERPSQLLLGTRSISSSSSNHSNPLSTSLTSSTGPLTSTVEAHASTTSLQQDLSCSRSLLTGIAASNRPAAPPPSHAALQRGTAGGFSKLVPSWAWTKWSVTPPSSTQPRSTSSSSSSHTVSAAPPFPTIHSTTSPLSTISSAAAVSSSSPNTTSTAPIKIPSSSLPASTPPIATPKMRMTGINQSGPIRGYRPPIRKTPTHLEPKTVDLNMLMESLNE